MAVIILFSNLWGIALKEWQGPGRRIHRVSLAGIPVLVAYVPK